MSAVGGGVGNSGMPAVYLLTLVYQLSRTLEWLPKAKKIPPGPELSAHQVDVIKVSRITKSLFNRSKEFPEVLGSTYHLQGELLCFLSSALAAWLSLFYHLSHSKRFPCLLTDHAKWE